MRKSIVLKALIAVSLAFVVAGCGSDGDDIDSGNAGPGGSDGPSRMVAAPQQPSGNAAAGQAVFRFATFGNERFWTDAVRLQQRMVAAGVTPLQALQLALHVDSDRVSPAIKQQLATELAADPSGQRRRC
ncbi:MAG: hypothetical protein M3Q32_05930 [Pseudomonadota bacterium]|nr:hypothetical protein [Pseudomonadota bacterium]